MSKKSKCSFRSRKNVMYDYLKDSMHKGELRPGEMIDLDQTAKKLGMSKTPLREALIMLEAEGLVSLLPWRGVVVNKLTLKDIKDIYQIIGVLESAAILFAAPRLNKHEIMKMEEINDEMIEAGDGDNYDLSFEKYLDFQNVYIKLADNQSLEDTLGVLKKRLYGFSVPFIKGWEKIAVAEHKELLNFLYQGQFEKAADYQRNKIWNFNVQIQYIVKDLIV